MCINDTSKLSLAVKHYKKYFNFEIARCGTFNKSEDCEKDEKKVKERIEET